MWLAAPGGSSSIISNGKTSSAPIRESTMDGSTAEASDIGSDELYDSAWTSTTIVVIPRPLRSETSKASGLVRRSAMGHNNEDTTSTFRLPPRAFGSLFPDSRPLPAAGGRGGSERLPNRRSGRPDHHRVRRTGSFQQVHGRAGRDVHLSARWQGHRRRTDAS